jgi:elongation factor G
VSGLGELHLEILRDRIEIDYGIKCELGKMQVAYRESVQKKMEHSIKMEKIFGGKPFYAEITLSIEPKDEINAYAKNLVKEEENRE